MRPVPMMSPLFLYCSHLFLLLFLTSATSAELRVSRLSPTGIGIVLDPDQILAAESTSDDFETYFYDQTIDHFNYKPESFATFRQRYLINSKSWGGAAASSPILVYLGAEAPIDSDVAIIGLLTDNAARFKALLVYIEHRFYGQSVPFGSFEDTLKNSTARGYFNSAQALADYAEIILYIQEQFQAETSPVIVIGGSYGGMLASWFRLKYPHIALGALASSAPILYFDDITPQDGYHSIVTKVFRETSETCFQTIKDSWAEIDVVASRADGLSLLSKKFSTCKPLNTSDELKDHLESMYDDAAQYNIPSSWVKRICGGVDGAAFGDDILSKVFAGLVAYKGNRTCYVNQDLIPSETDLGWRWQTCSDMVIPIGRNNNTMFPPDPFDLESYVNDCKNKYGVPPRPHWVTTYFGGHNITLILEKFGSNIIFSNGLKDPYSSGGVLEDISENIVSVATINGSHCLDILKTTESDADWLIAQRKTEINIIEGWISQYYADLAAYHKRNHTYHN